MSGKRYREKPWTLIARAVPSGARVWYYYWYDDRGRRKGPKSTQIGYSRKSDEKRTRREADAYCADLFRAGRLGTRAEGKTLTDFVDELHFFDWTRSRYVRGILSRSEKGKARITEGYVRDGCTVWESRIKPAHGGLLIDEIGPADCEDLLEDWRSAGYAHKTINNWRSYYSTVMGEAERLDVIPANPWRKVPALAVDSERRGGLTLAEGAAIISPDGLDLHEHRTLLYYLATKLAFLTGLRIAEVCGLYTDDVRSKTVRVGEDDVTMHYLDVSMQYDPKLRRRVQTKDKDRRAVPITPEVYAELESLMTGPERYLFSFHPRGETPITANRLRDWLYWRMEKVGIDRTERNISFHSARRFFNTLLRRRVSGDVLRKMTGHDSDEMTEHYTDYLPEDLQSIGEAQASVLRLPK